MTSPKVNINAAILVWARTGLGLPEDDAAKKLAISPERLAAWESGADRPTVKQLRKIAHVYKRPASVFYLQEVPATFQVMRDLRRLPGTGLREYSPGLLYEMRLARQRREIAIELLEEIGEVAPPFRLEATLEEDPEVVGLRLREALGVTYAEQTKWNEPRVAFRAWRDRIEDFGVLAFQATRVELDEASGFALAENTLPVIAVNRKDVWARRVFSLLHEFSHLMLRVSGASDLDVDAARPPEDARVETFCNQVAASALMPRARFLAEAIVQNAAPRAIGWSDEQIEALATTYSVSREAVVRRLLTFGLTTDDFYRAKRAQYAAERAARKQADRLKQEGKEFRTNPARDAVSDNGAAFVRLVLNNYYRERITLSDVSGYLGIRVKHVPRIELLVGSA